MIYLKYHNSHEAGWGSTGNRQIRFHNPIGGCKCELENQRFAQKPRGHENPSYKKGYWLEKIRITCTVC